MKTGHSSPPKFKPFEVWAACPRCGARVAYGTLRRERLTGLLVCGPASGRPVKFCWDPWPDVLDFQAYPDRSIEPPPEPYPTRWGLDDIWSTAPQVPAPDDATRLQSLLTDVPYYKLLGKSAAFPPALPTSYAVLDVTTIKPADWDGTFIPSGSVRTVIPPAVSSDDVNRTDLDSIDQLWGPPPTVYKGV